MTIPGIPVHVVCLPVDELDVVGALGVAVPGAVGRPRLVAGIAKAGTFESKSKSRFESIRRAGS